MQWAPNLCRICGRISETCHIIHQKDMTLEHKLKKCLNLEVYRQDYKPKQICNECYIKLNEYDDFIELCSITNIRFESMLMNKEDWSSENAITDYSQPQKSVIVTSKTVPDAFGCSEMDLYKDTMLPLDNLGVSSCSINDQTIIDIVDNSNSYEDISYINPSNYDKSYSNYYSQNTSVLHHSSDYELPITHCSSTSVVSYNNYQDKPVENQVTASKNDCNDYYYDYTEPCGTNLVIDFAADNTKEKGTQGVLPQVEKTVEKVKKTKNRTGKKMISVEAIKNYIVPNPDLMRPKKVKKGDNIFACSHCDKKFLRRITLKAHMAIHTKLRPFICDICGKSFAVKYDLTNHQKVHTDDFKCEHCQKCFPVPSKLERHLRTHTNHRPFVCDVKDCGLAFSDKRNLESHKSTHSDERNFKCSDCEKSFRTKNQLKEHSKAHSDELQYICDRCGKAYKWKANLSNHKKKHDGYLCPYCQKDCEKAFKLNKHKKECRLKCGL